MEITKPKQFEKEFNHEFTNYKIIIDEIENLYPSYRMDEKNQKIANELNDNNSNLTQSQSRLFSLQNNLENTTFNLREKNDKMIKEINELDEEIEKLERRYNNLSNNNNAAKFALQDFKFSYNEKLVYNIILGILIFGAIFLNYKKVNKQVQSISK